MLRGGNKKDTVTLITAPIYESAVATNIRASGSCLSEDYKPFKTVLNYEMYHATNQWSCAYIEEQTIRYEGETAQGPDVPIVTAGHWARDSRDVTDHQGTLVIPATDCY